MWLTWSVMSEHVSKSNYVSTHIVISQWHEYVSVTHMIFGNLWTLTLLDVTHIQWHEPHLTICESHAVLSSSPHCMWVIPSNMRSRGVFGCKGIIKKVNFLVRMVLCYVTCWKMNFSFKLLTPAVWLVLRLSVHNLQLAHLYVTNIVKKFGPRA